MSNVVTIVHDGRVYALFFPKDLTADGIRFLTKETDPFQVGLMERKQGHVVQPHRHVEHPVEISTVSEFLYIERGKVRVKVYGEEWKELHVQELSAGEFLLFLYGGHSIEVLEDARMIEVKQGPYPGTAAAKIYRS